MQLNRPIKVTSGFALTSLVFIATILSAALVVGNFERRVLEIKSDQTLEDMFIATLDLQNCQQYLYYELLTDTLSIGDDLSGCRVVSLTQDEHVLSVSVEKNARVYRYEFEKKYASWEVR
jgi:hypothetical protein